MPSLPPDSLEDLMMLSRREGDMMSDGAVEGEVVEGNESKISVKNIFSKVLSEAHSSFPMRIQSSLEGGRPAVAPTSSPSLMQSDLDLSRDSLMDLMDKMFPQTEHGKTIKKSAADVVYFMLERQEVMMKGMTENLVKTLSSLESKIMQRVEDKIQLSLDACSASCSRAEKRMEEQQFLSQHVIQGVSDVTTKVSFMTRMSSEHSQSLDFIIRSLVPDVNTLKTSVSLVSKRLDNLDFDSRRSNSESDSTGIPSNDMLSKLRAVQIDVRETRDLLKSFEDPIFNMSRAVSTDTNPSGRSIEQEISDGKDSLTFKGVQIILENMEKVKVGLEKIDSNVGNYTKKVVNNISDLWKAVHDLTYVSNITFQTMNATAISIDNDLNAINFSLSEEIPSFFNEDYNSIETKLKEFSDRIDESLQVILFNQKSFTDSCERIQLQEGQVYDEFDLKLEVMNETLSNLTSHFEQSQDSILEKMKNLESQMERLISVMKKKPSNAIALSPVLEEAQNDDNFNETQPKVDGPEETKSNTLTEKSGPNIAN